MIAGACAVAAFFPREWPSPIVFAALLACTCLTASWKVNLPISLVSGSTLSMSHAANVMALLIVGPGCRDPHRHRRLMDAVHVQGEAGLSLVPHRVQHGRRSPERRGQRHRLRVARGHRAPDRFPRAAHAARRGDRDVLPREQRSRRLRHRVVGPAAASGRCGTTTFSGARRASWWLARSAAVAAVAVVQSWQWAALLIFAPLYLTYRTYRVFLSRLDQQRRHVEETQLLHQHAVDALQQARRAEQALAAEKERLAVTLRSIADGLITTDLEGTILSINRVAEELTGWTQEQAIGAVALGRLSELRP